MCNTYQDVDSDAAKVFLEVGNTVDDHVFGITSSDEVLKEYEIEDGKIVLFKKVCIFLCVLSTLKQKNNFE